MTRSASSGSSGGSASNLGCLADLLNAIVVAAVGAHHRRDRCLGLRRRRAGGIVSHRQAAQDDPEAAIEEQQGRRQSPGRSVDRLAVDRAAGRPRRAGAQPERLQPQPCQRRLQQGRLPPGLLECYRGSGRRWALPAYWRLGQAPFS